MTLTPRNRAVLNLLAGYTDTPPTASEMTANRPISTPAVRRALRELAATGLVEKIGISFSGADTYRITATGTDALATTK